MHTTVGLVPALCPINEVTLRRASLVLWCATACEQVNHLGM